MKILGIDYGRRKIGLARSEGSVSEPWKVVRVTSFDEAVAKIEKEIEIEKPSIVVVGISEGEMGGESKKFALAIQPFIHSTIELFDETLTSQDAQRLSIEAGINRKKRKGMEDAYAAALILQNYLDSR